MAGRAKQRYFPFSRYDLPENAFFFFPEGKPQIEEELKNKGDQMRQGRAASEDGGRRGRR